MSVYLTIATDSIASCAGDYFSFTYPSSACTGTSCDFAPDLTGNDAMLIEGTYFGVSGPRQCDGSAHSATTRNPDTGAIVQIGEYVCGSSDTTLDTVFPCNYAQSVGMQDDDRTCDMLFYRSSDSTPCTQMTACATDNIACSSWDGSVYLCDAELHELYGVPYICDCQEALVNTPTNRTVFPDGNPLSGGCNLPQNAPAVGDASVGPASIVPTTALAVASSATLSSAEQSSTEMSASSESLVSSSIEASSSSSASSLQSPSSSLSSEAASLSSSPSSTSSTVSSSSSEDSSASSDLDSLSSRTSRASDDLFTTVSPSSTGGVLRPTGSEINSNLFGSSDESASSARGDGAGSSNDDASGDDSASFKFDSGTIAGIAVGAAVGLVLFLLMGVALVRRCRHKPVLSRSYSSIPETNGSLSGAQSEVGAHSTGAASSTTYVGLGSEDHHNPQSNTPPSAWYSGAAGAAGIGSGLYGQQQHRHHRRRSSSAGELLASQLAAVQESYSYPQPPPGAALPARQASIPPTLPDSGQGFVPSSSSYSGTRPQGPVSPSRQWRQ